MSFAPAIARNGFHYNGDLYVEVGNLNRHKRASIAEIKSLLRPDLKQSKAADTLTPKDQVGHWYEAQLIHYGLPPSKDKARAKMRLLEALNGSKLVVPKEISSLETEMKKEYAAADRKAKAAYKVQAGTTATPGSTAGKKRKQPDAANNISININFGSQGEVTSNAEKQPPAKRAKNSDGKAITKKDQNQSSPTRENRPIQTARRSTAGFSIGQRPVNVGDSSPTRPRPKQTPRRSTAGFSIGQRPGNVSSSPPAPYRTKQTARRSTGSFPVGQRSGIGSSPPAKQKPSMKKEPKLKQEPASQDLPKLGLLNGYYDIDCPTIEGEWPDWADDLSLVLTLDSPSMWAAYDFGIFSGIIHLPERPYTSSQESLPCSWRGRENGEGEMSFGDRCTGAITFLGGGRIEGWLSLYGRCEFSGMRRDGPGNAPRTAASMRQEWDGYNDEEYEAESRGRW